MPLNSFALFRKDHHIALRFVIHFFQKLANVDAAKRRFNVGINSLIHPSCVGDSDTLRGRDGCPRPKLRPELKLFRRPTQHPNWYIHTGD